MEDRKRPAVNSNDELAPPSKRLAVNGSKAKDDALDMKEESWVDVRSLPTAAPSFCLSLFPIHPINTLHPGSRLFVFQLIVLFALSASSSSCCVARDDHHGVILCDWSEIFFLSRSATRGLLLALTPSITVEHSCFASYLIHMVITGSNELLTQITRHILKEPFIVKCKNTAAGLPLQSPA